MAEHDLKIWPSYFKAVLDGSKPFEVRRADRDFAVGDVLVLKEWDPGRGLTQAYNYTGREQRVRVTYLMRGGAFGVAADHCVIGIQREPAAGAPSTPKEK